jgi:hypothetical protein
VTGLPAHCWTDKARRLGEPEPYVNLPGDLKQMIDYIEQPGN